MDELEYRRLLKTLPHAIEPDRDLWQGIDARLDIRAEKSPRRRHSLFPFAAAAGFVALAITTGWMMLVRAPMQTESVVAKHATPLLEEARALHAEFTAALVAGTGNQFATLREQADPRFIAAWIELDAAESELNAALATQPDARFILNRLKQVQHKRLQITQKALSA